MVSLVTAESALKDFYLGVITEQLNTGINPLLARIKQSTEDVWGKEIRKVASYGLNGGVGAGTETGSLPMAGENKYATFKSVLKNLYGTIEITDKAIRASETSEGAFVNLLNAEMEGLIKSSSFNFGRMLFGDGSGILANVVSATGTTVVVDSVQNLMEGQILDFHNSATGIVTAASGNRINSIDRTARKLTMQKPAMGLVANDYMCVQGSLNNELTGLGALFNPTGMLYGLSKNNFKWMNPYSESDVGDISEITVQKAIDSVEEDTGSVIDFIVCSSGVKRAYQNYLNSYKRNVDVMNLEGGYKAMSYNGIPLISDRFVAPGTMYLLNSKDFTLHQLCDWSWLEGDDGRVIKQVPGKPIYTATLVKYADILCDRPSGQAKLSGITEK